MRRIALILTIAAAAVAAALASAAAGDDSHTYYIELDNAFGLNKGSEVRVAGVTAGSISELLINSRKKAVAKVELSGPVAVLGTETICSSEPQSLIAEYFIDCSPKGDPIETTDESDDEHAENPDIPVEQTRQTVQNDLVLNALRLPFRERLTLLINEFGTALAGNAENLNEAIRRGAPALEQTREVFDLLAGQNTIIRDLNVDSERIISKLAERRQDVVDFIVDAGNTAEIAASRRDELSQNFALLDDFLAELRPTMAELNEVAVEGTPLASNLRGAAPGLNELSRNLPDFNPAATDALISLGKASVTGKQALDKGRDELRTLAEATTKSFSVADTLAKFLRDIDDPDRAVETDRRANAETGRKGKTGYTGMEGLLNYLYYQTEATNQYDEIGHLLHFTIFEVGTGPCHEYNPGVYDPDGPGPAPAEPGVPNAAGDGATTSILKANRCVAWLGRNQPGINQAVEVPPYSPKVCPNGSTDIAICDPSGNTNASFAPGETGDGAAFGEAAAPPGNPGVDPGGGAAAEPPPAAFDPGDVIAPIAPSQRQDAAAANGDLLGFLFGG